MKKTLLFLMLIVLQTGFGQEATVQPFLHDIVLPFPSVRDLTISPSEDEAYFTAQSPIGDISAILMTKKKNGAWSSPQIATFSGTHKDLEPFLSPDGLTLYFVSDRPLTNASNKPKDYDIWYVKRKSAADPWLAPVNMGTPVNSEHNEFYPAVSSNGNLYFTSDKPSGSKGRDDIFLSKRENGRYTAPVSLGEGINTESYEYNAWIAPDESILIFGGYNRKDGLGSGDLYISYKNAEGIWSTAKNMGSGINSAQMDYCPFVLPGTGTLYFTSKRSRLNHRPSLSNVQELLREITTYENGFSRLYKVAIKELLANPKK